jgi:predicted DNA binding protein
MDGISRKYMGEEYGKLKAERDVLRANLAARDALIATLTERVLAVEAREGKLRVALAAEHRNDGLSVPFTDREMKALRHARVRRLKCGGGCACDMCKQVIEMLEGSSE